MSTPRFDKADEVLLFQMIAEKKRQEDDRPSMEELKAVAWAAVCSPDRPHGDAMEDSIRAVLAACGLGVPR